MYKFIIALLFPILANAGSLAIYQGRYEHLGDRERVAQSLARFNVIVLSHIKEHDISTWINPAACNDYEYKDMPWVIARIRELSPTTAIFGYVSAASDHPSCGNDVPTPIDCPNGICLNVITWVNEWAEHDVDGIFYDYAGPSQITAATRDNVFSYAKSQGLRIMANAVFNPQAVNFQGWSTYFGKDDYVLIEGFSYAKGAYSYNMTAESLYWFNLWKFKGIHLAALATESDRPVNCNWSNNQHATQWFNDHATEYSVYQYSGHDLGIKTKELADCL